MSRISLLGIVLFTIQYCTCQKSPPPDIIDPGNLLFLGYVKKDVNCARCHGEHGQGGWKAPDIQNIFVKRDSAKIVRTIKRGHNEEEDMPAFGDKLTETELADLLRFLKTLRVE